MSSSTARRNCLHIYLQSRVEYQGERSGSSKVGGIGLTEARREGLKNSLSYKKGT